MFIVKISPRTIVNLMIIFQKSKGEFYLFTRIFMAFFNSGYRMKYEIILLNFIKHCFLQYFAHELCHIFEK